MHSGKQASDRNKIQPTHGPSMPILQDGKSPVRSDAYFPEWKSALTLTCCRYGQCRS